MSTDTVAAEQELLSLEDAAEFLCVSKSTMYRLLDQRKLAGMKAGKQWRFRKEDLLAYMRRGPAAQALAKVPTATLDAELAVLAAELEKAGTSTDACDDPALVDEAGKITQYLRRLVWLLHTLRGSDIHLNPIWQTDGAAVQLILRVDGALREIRRLPFSLYDALVLEWKRQAELPIEDTQHPHEGRAQFVIGETFVAHRVATVPTIYGEKVTTRAIPTHIPTLERLGIEQTPLKELAARQRGLLIFAGPTGSGKATTMMAFTQEILTTRPCAIYSVVAPIEYAFMQGVTHIDLAHMTEVEGMRAVMHHDPDVIVGGELRDDPALAQETLWAAETGHLVLTCQHASDPVALLYEMLEWGLKRELFAANLIGVVYQQLAPKLCAQCRVPATPEPAVLDRIRRAAAEGGFTLPEEPVFYRQEGCPSCGGRVALHEFLLFTPEVRQAFLQSASREEFTHALRAAGQLSFVATQVQQALAGKISLETLLRYLPY
jgi:type IV pilus assembly protein PilB